MVERPRVGVYPGTFDPITLGHADIIRRAARIVDRLVVAVAVNVDKSPLFSLDERTEMVAEEFAAIDGDNNGDGDGALASLEIRPFEGLVVDFVRQEGGTVLFRGLRAVSDFEFELQMTWMNARLDPGIETVFLNASEKFQFIASSLVKEIARLGGDVTSFVSPRVAARLKGKVG